MPTVMSKTVVASPANCGQAPKISSARSAFKGARLVDSRRAPARHARVVAVFAAAPTATIEIAPPKAGEEELFKAINTIRFLSIDGVNKANSGHPGLPMGCAPMGYLLYNEYMTHNPKDPTWFNRDRFVLSAGHGSMLQYSLMHLAGYDSVQVGCTYITWSIVGVPLRCAACMKNSYSIQIGKQVVTAALCLACSWRT